MTTIAYLRCSTEEQAESGAGIAAQAKAIGFYGFQHPGHDFRTITDLGVSGGLPWHQRPQLRAAIEDLNHGLASTLVVAKLDRLTRSLLDFATIMDMSRRHGWKMVALDLGMDTTTPAGEMLAGVLAVFAQFERRLISQRTKDALAAKRAQGVHTGRRSTLSDDMREGLRIYRDSGWSLANIAAYLNERRIPTGQNGTKWRASSVAAVLKSQEVTP